MLLFVAQQLHLVVPKTSNYFLVNLGLLLVSSWWFDIFFFGDRKIFEYLAIANAAVVQLIPLSCDVLSFGVKIELKGKDILPFG